MERRELGRQSLHAIIGLALILLLVYTDRETVALTSFTFVILGSILININFTKGGTAITNWFERELERKETTFPGWGPAWYLIGILLLTTFLVAKRDIISAIFVLAVGDGFSTLIGMYGKFRLPYNPSKTLEGSTAFFLASMPAYLIIGPTIFPLALFCAIAESLPFKIEDNLLIPIVAIIVLSVL